MRNPQRTVRRKEYPTALLAAPGSSAAPHTSRDHVTSDGQLGGGGLGVARGP